MEEVEVRLLTKDDLPFLFATWLKSYRASGFAKRIKKDVYFFWHHLMIERLLERATVKTVVACLKGHPDVIIGYLTFETVSGDPRVVHYCFVKESFRRMGVATELINGAGLGGSHFFFSHWTYALDPIVEKHEQRMIYDPYRI